MNKTIIFGDGGHIPPSYWGYKGGFGNITVCDTCGRTALYENQHPTDPCPSCGGHISSYLKGTYDNIVGRWVPPVTKKYGWFNLRTKEVKPGYWELHEGSKTVGSHKS